jgi:hypothetical protein
MIRPVADQNTMNTVLLVGLIVSVLAALMFSGSVVSFCRDKTVWSLLQIVGAGCLLVVGLCHVCETLHLFPSMHWGLKRSVGHYLDFWSATLGLTLFTAGYLFHSLTNRRVCR